MFMRLRVNRKVRQLRQAQADPCDQKSGQAGTENGWIDGFSTAVTINSDIDLKENQRQIISKLHQLIITLLLYIILL